MSCGIKHILTLSEAIVFNEITVINNFEKDITNECKFSWSSDRVCWTSWTTYDNYLDVCSNIEGDFYLRILISGVFGKLYFGNLLTNCFDICIDGSDTFLKNFCQEENLFNPYSNLDCALELYEQTSNSIICMFGIPAFYFRVVPKKDTANYTFKEYVLHNVESVKQIKLMVPDGSMPSSNPKFSELDFEWEAPWEVEIGKQQFAQAFGDTAFPKYQDFIYVPLMKRMWDVNAAYEEKNAGGVVYAMGDGNHSLASAKAHYEAVKAEIGADAAKDHPARYALCEITALEDESLVFEPIYRIIMDCDAADVSEALA